MTGACPACGSRRPLPDAGEVYQGGRGRSQFGRCQACGSFVSLRTYDAHAEAERVEHQPWGAETTALQLNSFKQRMFDAVLARLAAQTRPPGRVLDVGCSFGGFLLRARAAGYEGAGVDIGAPAVAHVRALGFEAARADTLADLPRDMRDYDAVTVLDVNCYWDDQPGELRAARDRLRPGGALALRVVDKSWMFRAGRALRPVWRRGGERLLSTAVNDHRFSMPLPSLLAAVADAGFDVTGVHVRDAIHSDRTRWPARAMFALGDAVWRAAGVNVAPGAVVMARRRA